MNIAPIADIKSKLKDMYPAYRFDIKPVHSTNSYSLTVFKEKKNISMLSVKAETPMNEFWEQIRIWMNPIIRKYG
jgi:hypothetical protein